MTPEESRHQRTGFVVYIALFAIAYLSFLTYQGISAEGFTRVSVITAAPAAMTNRPLQQGTIAFQAAIAGPVTARFRDMPPTLSLPSSKKEVSAEDRKKIRELSQTVTQSDDLNERANALRQLNDTLTEDAVQALARTIQTDPIARNRLLAISALRALGMQDDADGRIRALLRSPQNDTDTNVATNASDAYQQIENSAVSLYSRN